MLIVTTDGIEGRKIVEYLGIVSGDAIVGANVFRDVFARVRDVVGGRAVDLDYEVIGDSMLIVLANGTAVKPG